MEEASIAEFLDRRRAKVQYDSLTKDSSIKTIAGLVQRRLSQIDGTKGYHLTESDVRGLLKYINNMSSGGTLSNLPIEQQQSIIAAQYAKAFERTCNKEDPIIIRDSYYTNEILDQNGINKLLNAQDISDSRVDTLDYDISNNWGVNISAQTVNNTTNTSAAATTNEVRNAYIFVDSRYRVLNDDNFNYMNKVQFNLSNSPVVNSTGSIKYVGDIKDILEIEIYRFQIPNKNQSDEYYDRITMLIDEMRTQAYIDNGEDIRHHFSFSTLVQGYRMLLLPINCTYKFYKPITSLSALTLIFRNPFEQIKFNMDRFKIVPISDGSGYLTNPMSFETYNPVGNVVPHNIASGDLVYIDGIGNDDIDTSVSAQVNQPNGHRATRISESIFSIPVDASGILFDRFQDIIGTLGAFYITIGGITYYMTFPIDTYPSESLLASAFQALLNTPNGPYPGWPTAVVTLNNNKIQINDTAASFPGVVLSTIIPNSAGYMLGLNQLTFTFTNVNPGVTDVAYAPANIDLTKTQIKGPHKVILAANRILFQMRIGYSG